MWAWYYFAYFATEMSSPKPTQIAIADFSTQLLSLRERLETVFHKVVRGKHPFKASQYAASILELPNELVVDILYQLPYFELAVNRRARLVEHSVASRLVVAADLELLEKNAEESAAAAAAEAESAEAVKVD